MEIEKIIKSSKKLPLGKRVLINLTMISTRVDAHFTEALKPFGVSLQQFNVLRILRGQRKKALNLRDIQSRMVHKMSNTTRLVDKLIAKGLAERKVCPSNRRKVEITITATGQKLLNEMDGKMAHAENELVSDFSTRDLKMLNQLLDTIKI